MNDKIGMPPPSPAGWYPSTTQPGRLEYWDGARWTGQLAPPPVLPRPASGGGWTKLATWTQVGLVVTAAVLLVFLITSGAAGLLAAAGAIGLFTAGYVLITGRRSWAMLASKKVGVLVLVSAIVALAIGGSLAPRTEPTALQFSSESTAGEASPSPSLTRAPVVKTEDVVVTETVPFEAATVDDPTLAAGTAQVTVAGVAGIRTITYRVTTTDGRETKRTVVSAVITTAPVTQVTSNGTYVETAPAAPVPFADAGNGCDSNYSGACVPIASDVDCAGGSGNGPAYVAGPVYVVGSDVYDLDRDGDGIACDT